MGTDDVRRHGWPNTLIPMMSCAAGLLSALPKGDALAESAWVSRHRGILVVLWFHALGVPLFGLYMGAPASFCLSGGAALGLMAAIAQLPAIPRRIQSALSTCGLMIASALLVHFSGGFIELHFHFFVVMSVIVLYQDWLPFLVGLQFIILDHGLVGTMLPAMVYRHAEGQAHPWTWALIHGGFILAQCAALIYFWRVTEAAQAEASQSETRTRMIIETALDAVVTTDAAGAITGWNSQAEVMFDVSRTEVIGKSLTDYLSTSFPSTSVESSGRQSGLVLGAILNRRVEMRGRRRSGDHFPVEIAVSCLAAGDVLHFTTFVQDISERKEQEEVLRRAKDAAEAASLAKSQFLANMSHEIRTPMNGVLGMTELLLTTTLNDKQRRYADTVHTSGSNLLHIINDILDFSKIEAGRLELEHIPFDFHQMVNETLALYHERASKQGLTLTVDIAAAIPSTFHGDPHRLRQILTNLVGNALKFTERGGISVSVQSADEEPENIRIEVTDSGIGIPLHAQGKIFDSFSQADGSMTRKYGGTELGLAFVKQLVGMMGGHLGLQSRPGEGTTFWFTIPVEASHSVDTSQQKNPGADPLIHIRLTADRATVIGDLQGARVYGRRNKLH